MGVYNWTNTAIPYASLLKTETFYLNNKNTPRVSNFGWVLPTDKSSNRR